MHIRISSVTSTTIVHWLCMQQRGVNSEFSESIHWVCYIIHIFCGQR